VVLSVRGHGQNYVITLSRLMGRWLEPKIAYRRQNLLISNTFWRRSAILGELCPPGWA
jgi:hypothetical protein